MDKIIQGNTGINRHKKSDINMNGLVKALNGVYSVSNGLVVYLSMFALETL